MAPDILIVEDDLQLQQALTIRLSASGFHCETAANGREALEKLLRRPPALMIADLVMPEMDGYELIRRVRTDAQTSRIPILVLTAVPEHTRSHRQEDLQGVRILQKPFDSGILLGTVRELLRAPLAGGESHG